MSRSLDRGSFSFTQGDWTESSYITTVAPSKVREALKNVSSSNDNGMSELAKTLVNVQLAAHAEQQANKVETERKSTQSLFELVIGRVSDALNESETPEEDVQTILATVPASVVQRSIWTCDHFPYGMFRKIVGIHDSDPVMEKAGGEEPSAASIIKDIDEWILRNERWLRDHKTPYWHRHLVSLSAHAAAVFPGSTLADTARLIVRPGSLSGHMFLDIKHCPEISIQPSVSAFAGTFETMTNGLLRGLDWSNVCAAGGIVLGTLLSVQSSGGVSSPRSDSEAWRNSDIDLYIYGLCLLRCNAKLRHIYSIFQRNLPPGAPSLVVRNSKTITFFSLYPLRRIQVVLKLVESPKEVLLNFDLDVCAMCWDGSGVWMLPRACRALETGYSIFTMNLIHGHYLGERRASQDHRVFKYADKGYGIRILPSYIAALNLAKPTLSTLELNSGRKDEELSLDFIASSGRAWFEAYLRWWRRHNTGHRDGKPSITHGSLDSRSQLTEMPTSSRRDALSGFELLMRHVALWERACAGEVAIPDDPWSITWASTNYDDDENSAPLAYDDSPRYAWDSNFNVDDFKRTMDDFNIRETFTNLLQDKLAPSALMSIKRISYAARVEEILQSAYDIITPLYLEPEFAEFANQLIGEALKEKGFADEVPVTLAPLDTESDIAESADERLEKLHLWRISSVTMWQKLDRRIDEVHEILWSFRRANQIIDVEFAERCSLFKGQAARRVIRPSQENEFEEFVRWVARRPRMPANYFQNYFNGSNVEEDDDEMDEQ